MYITTQISCLDNRNTMFFLFIFLLLAFGCGEEKRHDVEQSDTLQNRTSDRFKSIDFETPDWSYHGDNAPKRWHSIKPEYSDCNGALQSPIDINSTLDINLLTPITTNYLPLEDGELLNLSRTLQLNCPNTGGFSVENSKFTAINITFHCPSEHTVKGNRFAMELQINHVDDRGNIAILSVFVNEGIENAFLADLAANTPPAGKKCDLVSALDINSLMPSNKSYYHYHGSLTHPPCTENVQWYILKHAISASSAQINAIKTAMVEKNIRPIQKLNGRIVNDYDE